MGWIFSRWLVGALPLAALVGFVCYFGFNWANDDKRIPIIAALFVLFIYPLILWYLWFKHFSKT